MTNRTAMTTITPSSRLEELAAALRPFAKLAEKKTWPDAPGETGPSPLDLIEGDYGTGELYLGTYFGTDRTVTLSRDDFEKAAEVLRKLKGEGNE